MFKAIKSRPRVSTPRERCPPSPPLLTPPTTPTSAARTVLPPVIVAPNILAGSSPPAMLNDVRRALVLWCYGSTPQGNTNRRATFMRENLPMKVKDETDDETWVNLHTKPRVNKMHTP